MSDLASRLNNKEEISFNHIIRFRKLGDLTLILLVFGILLYFFIGLIMAILIDITIIIITIMSNKGSLVFAEREIVYTKRDTIRHIKYAEIKTLEHSIITHMTQGSLNLMARKENKIIIILKNGGQIKIICEEYRNLNAIKMKTLDLIKELVNYHLTNQSI